MILDGKTLADTICTGLQKDCARLIAQGVHPVLTIITSGEDTASQIYVRNKIKRCEEIGIQADVRHFPCFTYSDFLHLRQEIKNPMIIQEPIRGTVAHVDVARELPQEIDADGFSVWNMGALAARAEPYFAPCTPTGVMRLLREYDVPLVGKRALVIGRSNIVGRPMSMMLEQVGCTVTIAHSLTPELALCETVRDADIIVSAVGKKDVFTFDCVNVMTGYNVYWGEKTIVDVGMNRDENGKLCGDISENLKQQCAFYTPVPGGVGPMTVAMLMENTIKFYERTAERS